MPSSTITANNISNRSVTPANENDFEDIGEPSRNHSVYIAPVQLSPQQGYVCCTETGRVPRRRVVPEIRHTTFSKLEWTTKKFLEGRSRRQTTSGSEAYLLIPFPVIAAEIGRGLMTISTFVSCCFPLLFTVWEVWRVRWRTRFGRGFFLVDSIRRHRCARWTLPYVRFLLGLLSRFQLFLHAIVPLLSNISLTWKHFGVR